MPTTEDHHLDLVTVAIDALSFEIRQHRRYIDHATLHKVKDHYGFLPMKEREIEALTFTIALLKRERSRLEDEKQRHELDELVQMTLTETEIRRQAYGL